MFAVARRRSNFVLHLPTCQRGVRPARENSRVKLYPFLSPILLFLEANELPDLP